MPNADLIKNRMAEEGISQADLARELGIAQPTVCQKINGSRPFFLEEAKRVAEILKIPSADFGKYFFKSEIA